MKIKKILMFIGIILGIIFVVILGWLVSVNKNAEENIINEITPAEEISNSQLRQTIITLYFMDKEKGELEPEARQIDVKLLLENPYELLINMLIEGPKNESLIGIIPQDTKINKIEIKNGIAYIDFNDYFINEQNLGEKQEKIIINSILKTLIELKEVNGIKILINGAEDSSFPDGAVNFNEVFYLE